MRNLLVALLCMSANMAMNAQSTLSAYTKAGDETVNIEAKPGGYTDHKRIRPDMDAIVSILGCIEKEVKMAALKNKTTFGSNTANNGGFWFNIDGYVCDWGSDAMYYVEPVTEGDFSELILGQYPDHMKIGDESTFCLFFLGNSKYYQLTVNLKIVEEESTEITYESVAQRSILVRQLPASEYVWSEGIDIPTQFIKESLGTSDWTVYGQALLDVQGNEPKGNAKYVNNYTISETPGFWLNKDGRNSGWGDNAYFGITAGGATKGKFQLMQYPGRCKAGDIYKTKLYYVDEKTGKMVTFNFTYLIVDQIVDFEVVGTETITLPVCISDSTTPIDLSLAAAALSKSVDELLVGSFLCGMTDGGFFDSGCTSEDGLSFNAEGYSDASNPYLSLNITKEGDKTVVTTWTEKEVAKDFSLNTQCCYQVGTKQYVFNLNFVSAGTSQTGIENLAPKAIEVYASVDGSEHPVSAVNDNLRTATSYWSTFHGDEYAGQYEYVELQWDRNNSYTQIVAYWVATGENLTLPTDAYVAWWDGHEWQKGATLSTVNANGISTTDVELTSNRLRIYVKAAKGCGLRELRILGREGDQCIPAILTDYATIAWNEGSGQTLSPTLTLPEGEEETPIWNWTLPDGTTATTPSVTVTQPGTYIVSYQRQCGAVTELTYDVYDPSVSYTWPVYSPTLNYDFRWEYPKLSPPTKGMLPENVGMVGHKTGEWWACGWGNQRTKNKYITDLAIENLLKKMDEDFAYFRDEFGWPPDKRARNGYYSTVYIYGSGIEGNNDYKALGGWQSATNYNGQSWPMVYISYYPVACFDPSFTYDSYRSASVNDAVAQQNACVHEGIHATFADLDGCKQSAWFHEGGNTWLQGEAELAKSGKEPSSMGWLSAGNMVAPFMPIECYSGWLLDDTFGGPSAEGVNMYGESGQICTWRKLLGGVQYGELFPHFLSEIMGRGAIPWIWRYCKGRVLEGIADSLGDRQTRHLILEYRARQAMIDVGQWSKACQKLIDDNWGGKLEQEWSPYYKKVEPWVVTPYANMYRCNEADSAGWWRPEWRTTPGWSGANQIPLHVKGDEGNTISLHFKPLGKNMVCMLCYRTKQGHVYYSRPVEGEGDVVMTLKEKPANNVVIAVVCNTDYKYLGEETRKQHFDYRLRMGDNIYQPAKAQLKWYNYKQNVTDREFITGIKDIAGEVFEAKFTITPERTVVQRGERLPLHIAAASQLQVPVRLVSLSGQQIYQQSFMRDGDFEIPVNLTPGMYILQGINGKETSSVKIIVK